MAHARLIMLVLLAGTLVTGCAGGQGTDEQGELLAPAAERSQDRDGADRAGVLVDVAGHVRRPGVYRLPPGARVHEAIEAAGGARSGADLTLLNRAAALVDGQQIVVGSSGAAGGASGSGAGAGDAVAAKVSINSADAVALDALPGIGPVTAARIVEERTSGGPFASVDDLARVPGVGPATIESLREVVTT